jgi:hypothetical protein
MRAGSAPGLGRPRNWLIVLGAWRRGRPPWRRGWLQLYSVRTFQDITRRLSSKGNRPFRRFRMYRMISVRFTAYDGMHEGMGFPSDFKQTKEPKSCLQNQLHIKSPRRIG